MDRLPCDGHCPYRCWSRTGKPAAAHPHRGGWYVFAKTKPLLQIQSAPLNLPRQILTTVSTIPSSSLPPLPASNTTVATWYSQPYFGLCTFFTEQTVTHFVKATFFGFFFLMLLNFNTWYGIFSCRPPTSHPNCHFWNSVFERLPFLGTWQKDKFWTVGITKGGRIFFFFWRPFFKIFFLPSCDWIIFYSFFPCSIAKILVVLQAFETLEAPLWLHFSILTKHIFIPCFKNPLYPFLMFQD